MRFLDQGLQVFRGSAQPFLDLGAQGVAAFVYLLNPAFGAHTGFAASGQHRFGFALGLGGACVLILGNLESIGRRRQAAFQRGDFVFHPAPVGFDPLRLFGQMLAALRGLGAAAGKVFQPRGGSLCTLCPRGALRRDPRQPRGAFLLLVTKLDKGGLATLVLCACPCDCGLAGGDPGAQRLDVVQSGKALLKAGHLAVAVVDLARELFALTDQVIALLFGLAPRRLQTGVRLAGAVQGLTAPAGFFRRRARLLFRLHRSRLGLRQFLFGLTITLFAFVQKPLLFLQRRIGGLRRLQRFEFGHHGRNLGLYAVARLARVIDLRCHDVEAGSRLRMIDTGAGQGLLCLRTLPVGLCGGGARLGNRGLGLVAVSLCGGDRSGQPLKLTVQCGKLGRNLVPACALAQALAGGGRCVDAACKAIPAPKGAVA